MIIPNDNDAVDGNGIEVVSNTRRLNFIGDGVNITKDSSHTVTVTINKGNETALLDLNHISYFVDDFNQCDIFKSGYWKQSVGHGAYIYLASDKVDSTHPGILKIRINSSNNSSASQSLTDLNTGLKLGGGVLIFETLLQLFNVNDSYESAIGIGDQPQGSVSEHTNGVYFLYDHSESAYWQAVTSNASTKTKTITTVLVAADSWTKLKIVVNATASSVEFHIGGILVAMHTTNIPASTTLLDFAYKMLAQATGSSYRTLYLDYHMHKIIFTTAR